MNNFDFSSLNTEQKAALVETEGAVLVTAGAGSGKTRLLTHRVAFLLSKGISPYNILAITFTNKATREMAERVKAMCPDGDRIWISTFHSMCAKILRMDADALGYNRNFTIYAEDDSEKVVKEILNEMSLAEDKWKKNVLFHISNWKNTIMSLAEYERACAAVVDIKKIVLIIDEYEKRLKKNNALDFDDLLIKTYKLFLNHDEIRLKYAQRFEYILVDEFQDTNTVQYELVRQLASVHGNIFVVGDEDQCIYSWRGANFKNIFNFKKDFQNVKVFKLERNYRSTGKILERANKLIAHNSSRLEKKLWTERQGGDEPVIYNAVDERDEALFVANTIERLLRQGYKPSDFAILMRLNALTRNLEEALLSYNIPHKIYGGFKFYERAEIKNIIAYLRLFVNMDDDIAFQKVINFPRRGIGDGALSKMKHLAGDKSLLRALVDGNYEVEPALQKKLENFMQTYCGLSEIDMPLADFVSEVISKFKIKDAYDTKTEEGFDKQMNISSFEGAVREFAKLNPTASLSDFLESITLASDSDEIGEGGSVTIATVHAVKGLEFRVVFIIGLEEGIFPISRANSADDIEEERRLMYVAVTRAEEKVILTHCSKRFLYGKTSYEIPSRFCKELGFYEYKPKKIEETSVFGGGRSYSASAPTQTSFGGFTFNKATILGGEQPSEIKPTVEVGKYKPGQMVEHPKFGKGEIKSISDDGLVGDIAFEGFGIKSLMLEIAPLKILEG